MKYNFIFLFSLKFIDACKKAAGFNSKAKNKK